MRCSDPAAIALGAVVRAALLALQGVQVHHTNGTIGDSPEETMQNVGTLSPQGTVESGRWRLAMGIL